MTKHRIVEKKTIRYDCLLTRYHVQYKYLFFFWKDDSTFIYMSDAVYRVNQLRKVSELRKQVQSTVIKEYND